MISISLVDFIGKINDGVGVILSLEINEVFYEMMYWFNPENKHTLVVEKKFYEDFPNIKDIMLFEPTLKLLEYINLKVLPPREEIFKKYLNHL